MPKRSKEQWLALFQQHDESGLPASEFCQQKSLCPKYFSLRKKQLGWQGASRSHFVRLKPPPVPKPALATTNNNKDTHCYLNN